MMWPSWALACAPDLHFGANWPWTQIPVDPVVVVVAVVVLVVVAVVVVLLVLVLVVVFVVLH